MAQINVKAYAKINTFLNVVKKREDSLHEIESVMQTISLADEILISTFESFGAEVSVSCVSGYAPDGEENIAYRAAKTYLECANLTARVEIKLEKNIPSPAGLGGGSADAAAILRGLNQIFGKFDSYELQRIACLIGSDVPFCIKGGTKIIKGIGDEIYACDPMPCCYIAVACGDGKMPTPLAYKTLDERYDDFNNLPSKRDINLFVEDINSITKMSKGLYNIFEEVVSLEFPEVYDLKQIMVKNSAAGTLMSGSGTAVFGVFEDKNNALNAINEIKKLGMFTSLAIPVPEY